MIKEKNTRLKEFAKKNDDQFAFLTRTLGEITRQDKFKTADTNCISHEAEFKFKQRNHCNVSVEETLEEKNLKISEESKDQRDSLCTGYVR